MIPFFKLVSTMPFVGKFAIGKELFEVYEATDVAGRRKEYREALLLLILMVLGHGVQAVIGFAALAFTAPWWVKVYFFLYGFANVSVTLTQIWLLYRVTDFHLTKPFAKRERKFFEPNSKKFMTAYTFTLLAQGLFILAYKIYVS